MDPQHNYTRRNVPHLNLLAGRIDDEQRVVPAQVLEVSFSANLCTLCVSNRSLIDSTRCPPDCVKTAHHKKGFTDLYPGSYPIIVLCRLLNNKGWLPTRSLTRHLISHHFRLTFSWMVSHVALVMVMCQVGRCIDSDNEAFGCWKWLCADKNSARFCSYLMNELVQWRCIWNDADQLLSEHAIFTTLSCATWEI